MKYILYLCAFVCVSCVSQSTYYIELAPRYDSLNEEFFRSSSYISGGSEFIDYKVLNSGLKGVGGQISLMEISDDVLYARIGYFFNTLKSDSFSYTMSNVATGPSEMEAKINGMNLDIGFRIWHFSPHLFSRYSKFEFVDRTDLNSLLPNGSTSVAYAGGGLAIDIPLSKRFSLLLNSQFSRYSQTYTVGLMMGGWVLEYPNNKKRSSSRK